MRHLSLAFAFYVAWAAAACAEKTVPVDYSAPVQPEKKPAAAPLHAEHLDRQSKELKGAAADTQRADAELHDRARQLFDGINESGSEHVIEAPRLEGWDKPDPYIPGAHRDEVGVDEMLDRVGTEISKARKAKEPAPPQEVVSAYRYGKWMRGQGKMDYTDALNSNQLGVYVYKPDMPVGIFFNSAFFQLQTVLGNAFAAATAVHESAHSRDHAEGKLNAKEVKKGEISAYQTEYGWLRTIDPKGHKLAWARVTFCSNYHGEDSNNVCSYLEHLAQILRYGDKNDFEGLVTALGYRDRTTDPFQQGNAEVLSSEKHFPWEAEDYPIQSYYGH